ncbi:MAG: hypothetical protein ACRDOK_02595 [Streptosporangiaceae bacterium]
MSFDAGTIIARMDLDTTKADAKLKEFESKAGLAEKDHKIRLSAVFDDASLGKARNMFAQLDNMISKDAANRLRSSPQGSVLGALNALFSPHPVTGAPSASQSASQGLLGKVAQQPTRNVPGTAGSSAGGGSASTTEQTAASSNASNSRRRGGLVGGLLSGGLLSGGLSGLLRGAGGGAGGAAGGAASAAKSGGGAVSSLMSGIGPGIGGIGALPAIITAAGAALIAMLPALTAVAGGLAVLGGGFAILMLTNAKFAANIKATFGGMKTVIEKAVAPLAGPLEKAFSQLGVFVKQIGPDLKQVFSAAIPFIEPLVSGIEKLMTGAGPGFLAMLKAAGPAMKVFSGVLASLGSSLGTMFKDFASVIGPSSKVMGGLLDALNGIFPLIGSLAKVLAPALSTAFAGFTGVLIKLLPALTPVGKILGEFAGAVLDDLVSAFGALATLLGDLAPSFATLASVLGTVFSVMENSGTFAILGDVLENLAPVLANLINTLVTNLAPILPVLFKAIGQIADILVGSLGTALTAILKVLTPVVAVLARVIARVIEWLSNSHLLIPVLILVASFIFPITTAIGLLVVGITELATHWSQVWGDIKHWAEDAWNFIYNGFGKFLLPLLGPAGLIALGVIELYKNWSTVWGWIQGVVSDFYTWFWTDFLQPIYTWLTKTMPGWFESVPGMIEGYFKNAISWLVAGGKNIITGLWNGIKDIWSDVENFFKNVASHILGWLGIHSPPQWAIDAGKDIMNGLGLGLTKASSRVAQATAAIAAATVKTLSGAAGSVEALMQSMAARRGWTGAQWTALYNVEMREAGFNMYARNPTSGAYGLAQFIQGPAEYAEYGGNSGTAAGQITGMLNYIAQQYGTPEGAWAHEQGWGWYDRGGWLMPGTTVAVNNTGQPEAILTQPQLAAVAAADSGMRQAPLIGTYQTAYYGIGDTTEALRELTRTLKVLELQSVVIGQ